MSRTITLSTAVFAAIWAKRKEGEETEDAILRRLLECGGGGRATELRDTREGGFYDARNGVHFPEGFEVFRNYKRREYKAIARGGMWVREDTAERFSSLNRLNESIALGNENVWSGNWKYRTADGSFRPIAILRE